MWKFLQLVFLLLLISSLSCQEEDEYPKAYFEYVYVNHAWGFQYTHWIIDDQGHVRMQSNPGEVVRIKNGFDPVLDEFDSVVAEIPMDTLRYYTSFIPKLATGKIESQSLSMADFGGYEYNCFYGDKVVILHHLSDTQESINKNIRTPELLNWLQGIGSSIRE